MTPLQLEILIKIYAGQTIPDSDLPSAANQLASLVNWKLLANEDQIYSITARGEFYVKYLLNVPLPKSTWHIPPHPLSE